MTLDQYLPYLIQLGTTIIAFAFILGKYKAAFDQHEKILTHHEDILKRHEKMIDKHSQAIDGILNRLDLMNGELHYLKGFHAGKVQT